MTSFNTDAPAGTPTSTPAAGTPNATQTPAQPGVVIEYNGRKFTQEDVLNKLANADQFIEQLKAERAEDRRLLTEATAALRTTVAAKELLQTPTPAPTAPAAPDAPVFDVASQVEQVITAREVKQTQDANWKAAQEAMTAAYGANADAKAKQVAAEVGMSVDALVSLAKSSPAAFKRLFPELSTAPKTPVAAAPSGGFNQAALPVTGEGRKSSGFWEAKSSKDQVSAYLNRLKELSGV